ncbi:hypothetical protein COLO4_04267 [Corchorus olitorius]|uniref:DOMON domain-containing protein n=1 Tax=Corchorus olitorius TaxID=93759 RepID=A0A1R3KUM8_9ROSI|nr:hypothetical protein COLO4_04267 [Corchorus olitorius]
MAETSTLILLICILTSLVFISPAQTCLDYPFPGGEVFHSCTHLPVLDASLHWTYFPSNSTVQIAYRAAQTPTGWIAWAINPMGTGMVGSQAFVAFRHSNGSMIAYTTPIPSYNPSMEPEKISIPVSDISTVYVNSEMIIFAVLGPLD